jgi:hypothetical protein
VDVDPGPGVPPLYANESFPVFLDDDVDNNNDGFCCFVPTIIMSDFLLYVELSFDMSLSRACLLRGFIDDDLSSYTILSGLTADDENGSSSPPPSAKINPNGIPPEENDPFRDPVLALPCLDGFLTCVSFGFTTTTTSSLVSIILSVIVVAPLFFVLLPLTSLP